VGVGQETRCTVQQANPEPVMSDGFVDSAAPLTAQSHGAPVAASSGAAELSAGRLHAMHEAFESDEQARLLQNAAVRTRIEDVALSRSISTSTDFTFSHVLDDWACTKQGQSGRCWMFAGLNLLRVGAM